MRAFSVPLSTATLHVSEHGDAASTHPALVLLHHFGGSGRTWNPVVEILAGRGFRCIAPDLRGFGGSRTPGDAPARFTVDSMANDMRELVTCMELERWAIVGHSMGGKVALALAAQQPPGLQAVALLAPSPLSPEPMPEDERARLLAGYGDPDSAGATLQKITRSELPDELRAVALTDLLRASAPA